MAESATIVEDQTRAVDEVEEDVTHWVCHCTDNNMSFCGVWVADSPWRTDVPDEQDCVMCVLTEQFTIDTCPWGCDCEDCE